MNYSDFLKSKNKAVPDRGWDWWKSMGRLKKHEARND